ncbi:hypothetical protein KI387_033386, partial [Taxus chinensis]
GRILEHLPEDRFYEGAKQMLESQGSLEGRYSGCALETDGLLRFHRRIYVPKSGDLRSFILTEAHRAPYAAHPGVKKMHADLRELYYWPGLRRDIADFFARFLECQRVKAEHSHPAGLLQPHDIPEWKWDVISMDFIVGLPMSSYRHDAIMVTVDKLTKVAHFSPTKVTYNAKAIAKVFMEDIVRLHGIPKTIINDRDTIYTSVFWTSFQAALGTQINFSSAYHPETDGQTER